MFKGALLLILVFMFLTTVSAQNESGEAAPGLSTFAGGEATEIAPPPPPEVGEGPAKFTLLLQLRDIETKNLIGDVHVDIEIYEEATEELKKTLKYVGDDGVLELKLEQGEWKLTLKVDELTTPGKDYFITYDFYVEEDINQTIYLLPVGSIVGTVYDESKNAIVGANLKFECGASYGETGQQITDSFGSFASYWLPVGSCKIYAAYKNRVGDKEIEIQKGQLDSVEITMSRGIISSPYIAFYLIVALLLLLGIFYSYHRKKEAASEIVEEPKEAELNQRAKDILKTLNDKERGIVNFLLKNDFESTQAKIYYSTGIPKTTLSRCLQSLENKRIVSTEKIGKMKKVKLTDWFLEKE